MEPQGPPPPLKHPPMKFFKPLIKKCIPKIKDEISKEVIPVYNPPTLQDCICRIDNLEKEITLIKLLIKRETY
jgi:hypothetical protein